MEWELQICLSLARFKNSKMILMKTMKKIAFLTLFLFALNISAQSALLQYNLKKGDKYQIEMKMNQNMAPIMTMDIGITMTTETIGVKDGKIENKSNISRMLMDLAAQGEKVSFDSAVKDEDLTEEEKKMKAEIAPALDMIIYQTMDKTGKLLEQKTVPEMKQADQILSQNQITAMVYPKEPVKVGSTWDYSQNMNGMNVSVTYTVTKITSSSVFADISGKMAGMADAKVSGKLEIDRTSGMPANVTMDIAAGTSAMGLQMKIEMNSKKL